jgi:hypothetical protein
MGEIMATTTTHMPAEGHVPEYFLRTFSSEQEANAFRDGLEFFEQYVEVEDVFEDSEETWAVKFRRVA